MALLCCVSECVLCVVGIVNACCVSDGGERERAGAAVRDGAGVHAAAARDAARAGAGVGRGHGAVHAGAGGAAERRAGRRARAARARARLRRLQHARLLPPPRTHDRGTPPH